MEFIFQKLNTNIKNLYWRLGPFPDEWGILEKLNNKIQNINLSKEKNFEKDVLNARLSIHVDIQTTFGNYVHEYTKCCNNEL